MITFNADGAYNFLAPNYVGLNGLLWIGMFAPNKGSFFPTTEEGIEKAVRYAAWLETAYRPAGIYWRVSTVRAVVDKGRGLASDSLVVPSYWADLDFGLEGHKVGPNSKPNPPTFEAAVALITEAGLPSPTLLINSGGGAYPLWRINRVPTLDVAAQVSENIQLWIEHASHTHGWGYGTGVKDLARVLRLPGSVNRKTANHRPCHVVWSSGELVSNADLPDGPPPRAHGAAAASGVLPPRRDYDANRSDGPADVIAEMCSWAEILEPAGWDYVNADSSGGELWMRPGGASSEYSARAFEHNLVVWSEAAGLPVGAEQRLTKARVYAWLWHGGNLSEAITALMRGDNRGGLPQDVLRAIRATSQLVTLGHAIYRKPALDEFMRGETPTVDMLAPFLATYTRYREPRQLGHRVTWMKADGPTGLHRHAGHMVREVIDGLYPADRALDGVRRACEAVGVTDPAAPRALLSYALEAATR